MKRVFSKFVFSGLFMLAACGTSPKTHFFALEPDAQAPQPLSLPGPAIDIGKVSLPPELDRRALVLRTGPNTVEIRDAERWAGPLDLMVRDTLALDLSNRLRAASVLLPGQSPTERSTRPITVVIDQFLAGPDQRVRLGVRWTLYSQDGRTLVLEDIENITVTTSSLSGQDIAEGMSRALAELAKRMVTKLMTIRS